MRRGLRLGGPRPCNRVSQTRQWRLLASEAHLGRPVGAVLASLRVRRHRLQHRQDVLRGNAERRGIDVHVRSAGMTGAGGGVCGGTGGALSLGGSGGGSLSLGGSGRGGGSDLGGCPLGVNGRRGARRRGRCERLWLRLSAKHLHLCTWDNTLKKQRRYANEHAVGCAQCKHWSLHVHDTPT